MRSTTSVIVTNFNYGRFLPTALLSALNQTATPREIIVVDDGSTDETEHVLRQFQSRVHIVRKDNGGQASAFNAGIAHSSGDLISFLDADDWWKHDKVEAVEFAHHQAQASGVSVAMIRHDLLLHRDGEGDIGRLPGIDGPTIHPRRDLSRALCERLSVPTSGLTLTRAAATAIVPIPERSFRISADAYLYTFARALGATVDVSHVLGYYRLHRNNAYQRSDLERLTQHFENEMALLGAIREKGVDPYIPYSLFRVARLLGEIREELRLSTIERVLHAARTPKGPARRLAIIIREVLEGWSGSTLGRPPGQFSVAPLTPSGARAETKLDA